MDEDIGSFWLCWENFASEELVPSEYGNEKKDSHKYLCVECQWLTPQDIAFPYPHKNKDDNREKNENYDKIYGKECDIQHVFEYKSFSPFRKLYMCGK